MQSELGMQFHFEHRIAAPLAAVEAAVLDPERLERLPTISPFIRTATLLSWRDLGDTVERRAELRAEGLRKQVGPWFPFDQVEWRDHIVWNRQTHFGTFEIDPRLPLGLRSQVICRGVYRLAEDGPSATHRFIEGEVEVDLPALGDIIVEAIVRLIRIHFDHDVGLLTSRAHAIAEAQDEPAAL
ncbi:MAG TPA: hypothetical protein VGG33_09555 [Polyangia bacterium]